MTCAVSGIQDGDMNVIGPSINYNTGVTYSCNTGYQLSGTATLTCQANGNLSAAKPTCNSKLKYCQFKLLV